MTPKEKAKELYNKMPSSKSWEAKECALIAVHEIIDALNTTECNTTMSGLLRNDYWQEVKEEIEKL